MQLLNVIYRGFYPLDSHISIDELRQDFTEVETNPDDNNISWLPYAVSINAMLNILKDLMNSFALSNPFVFWRES